MTKGDLFLKLILTVIHVWMMTSVTYREVSGTASSSSVTMSPWTTTNDGTTTTPRTTPETTTLETTTHGTTTPGTTTPDTTTPGTITHETTTHGTATPGTTTPETKTHETTTPGTTTTTTVTTTPETTTPGTATPDTTTPETTTPETTTPETKTPNNKTPGTITPGTTTTPETTTPGTTIPETTTPETTTPKTTTPRTTTTTTTTLTTTPETPTLRTTTPETTTPGTTIPETTTPGTTTPGATTPGTATPETTTGTTPGATTPETTTTGITSGTTTPGTTPMTTTPEIDPCTSSPCQNGGICSSSGSVYYCECPDTHVGPNCETDKSNCSITACSVKETCNQETNMCECTRNHVRSTAGVCIRPVTLLLTVTVEGVDNITSFEDIVDDPQSQNAVEIRQRLTTVLFGIYRERYGDLFIGIVITAWRLGSLEVDAEILFDNNTASMQLPTPSQAAQVFMDSLLQMGNSTGGFIVDPTKTAVVDVDECSDTTLNDCNPAAECKNTVGSFTCSCTSPGFTDTSPTELGPGRQCQVSEDSLSRGAIAGIVTAGVLISSLVLLLIYCLIIKACRMVTQRRSESLAELRHMNLDKDHPSDVELGSVVRSDNGNNADNAHDNEGFSQGSEQLEKTNPL